jgi:NitT/TauT family transport system substrate-binding protein
MPPVLPGRRALLRAAALSGAVLPALAIGNRVLASSRPAELSAPLLTPEICRASFKAPVVLAEQRAVKLSFNANAVCTVGVPVAKEKGFFAKHNLDVELVNFAGSTDQLLEAIATGKSDGGVGMALRWLKPLEGGFDVKIASGIHGGCLRLFAKLGTGITSPADLRGKRIGVSDLTAPDHNFFAILLKGIGIDPVRDVEWAVFAADILPVALQKGEIDAFSLSDPLGWIARDRDGLVEVATNLSGEYAHRTCCVLGLRGSLVRQDRDAATALVQALQEAQEWITLNPDGAAAVWAPYAKAKPEQLAAMLRSHTHAHHPLGAELRAEIAAYAAELKTVGVIKPSTDPARYAERVTVDLLT